MRVDPQLAAYLTFTTLLVITPGQATAVIVRNTIEGGPPRGMAAALGAFVGNVAYAVATALGIAAIVARDRAVFDVLQIGGALYLGWLGVRGIWMAWTIDYGEGSDDGKGSDPGEWRRGLTPSRRPPAPAVPGFGQGLLANLLNPSVATFYFIAVPSFLPSAARADARFALYAAIHVAMAFAYHSTWALGFGAFQKAWNAPAARRTLETLTGVALLALAARLAI